MARSNNVFAPSMTSTMDSDQGRQYACTLIKLHYNQKTLHKACHAKEIASMESFFAVLKTEFFYLNKFIRVEQLEYGINEYIRYYHHDRIKLKLKIKGLSSVQYRTQPLYA